jgi:hypothetical protein
VVNISSLPRGLLESIVAESSSVVAVGVGDQYSCVFGDFSDSRGIDCKGEVWSVDE